MQERFSQAVFGGASFQINRRTLLKSAGLITGASAFSGRGLSLAQSSSASGGSMDGLRKNMVGYMLAHEQFPVPRLVHLGELAEENGFDLLATSDHFQPWQTNEGHAGEAWVTMGAITQRTRKIWIGPTVTCPTFRYNPAVVAETYASLSLLAPGRIFLGIGSGEALNEQAATGVWPKWLERSERFIEAADIIRKMWTGETVSHKGRYYNVHAKLYDRPTKPIPLLMAANGPKAMYRAGQHGDGLITDPKTWKIHKPEFEAGARAAGKNLADMPVLVEQYAVVGDKNDAEAAAELWRFGPKAFKTLYNVRDPGKIQKDADAQIPLDQVYEGWAIGTDPNVHLKKIHELFDSGVTIVNVHCGQPDQERVIHFYGKEVLPKLRR